MRAFLCSIAKSVWDAIENGWTRLEAAKSTWDKQLSRWLMLIVKLLMLYFVVSHRMNFIGILMC